MPQIALPEPAEQRQIDRLLTAARETIAEVPFCWVMTRAMDGGVSARVVKENTGTGETDPWTRWFLARSESRKSAEIRRDNRVTLAYQHSSGNAYVTLIGRAELIDDRSAVQERLRPVDDPDGSLGVRLIAVRVIADRIELHVRGLTAEPWGHGRTLLGCDQSGVWRFLSD